MSKKVFLFLTMFFFSNMFLYSSSLEFITPEQLKKVHKYYGKSGEKRLLLFDKMLSKAKNRSIVKKLTIVNNFFNKFTYKPDNIHWKEKDYWASPFEFIGSGAGDCEDYAIAKYFALRLLGVESSKLQISFGVIKNKGINKDSTSHVVLNYYHNKNLAPVVLDNVNKQLKVATKRKDLKLLHNYNISEILTIQNLVWS